MVATEKGKRERDVVMGNGRSENGDGRRIRCLKGVGWPVQDGECCKITIRAWEMY